MTVNELVARSLTSSTGMLSSTLADFSDAEMMVRPVPAANHATWQLGHLVVAAHGMLSGSGAPLPALPAGFAERYTKETAGSNDPKKFDSKAELLSSLTWVNEAAAKWAKTLTAADLSKAAPESLRSFCPTVADVLNLQAVHMAMHMGQMQVIRRKLGKPVMF